MKLITGVEILSADIPNVEPRPTAIVAPEPKQKIIWEFWREA
jgi:hypothetical protein